MANRIFSLVFWLGAALVVAALGVRFLVPAQNQYAIYLAWGGLGCMLVYTLTQWREIAQMFAGRQARYGALSTVSILIVLGILSAVNYIGAQQKKRWDLTENQAFSLSDQTRNVLAKLDAPLQVRVFAREADFLRFRDRLGEYEYLSSQITTEYIDPDRNPAAAQQYEVQSYGTIVVSYRDRTERTTMDTEQDITNTIIKAVTGAQKKVLFTQGHGERDIASSDREGYSAVAEALKRENYAVESLALAQAGSIPEGTSVIVVSGPRTDFLEGEITAISDYLAKGGKLMLMLDPPERADAPPLANLIGLARAWGVEVNQDVVVDASGMGRLFGASEAVPLAVNYPTHPITDRFSLMTMYPFARSVTVMAPPPDGKIVQPVVETGEQSWAETNLKGLFASQPVEPDNADRRGPITVAASTTASVPAPEGQAPDPDTPRPETRVVVFGDSDFAATSYLDFQGNRDLFMNSIGWLAQQENLISIRPKATSDRRITMTAAQQTNLIWLSLLLVPGFIFGAGFYSWWRRR
jgi:ABC-type uncharacterized transport system involved in gliding motility auxiliary subunit